MSIKFDDMTDNERKRVSAWCRRHEWYVDHNWDFSSGYWMLEMYSEDGKDPVLFAHWQDLKDWAGY